MNQKRFDFTKRRFVEEGYGRIRLSARSRGTEIEQDVKEGTGVEKAIEAFNINFRSDEAIYSTNDDLLLIDTFVILSIGGKLLLRKLASRFAKDLSEEVVVQGGKLLQHEESNLARITAEESSETYSKLGRLAEYDNAPLPGKFSINSVTIADEEIIDVIGRQAYGRTSTIAGSMNITVRSGLSSEEVSITLYHEVLDAAIASSEDLPRELRLLDDAGQLAEVDIDRIAKNFHNNWGKATPGKLCNMLEYLGF